VFAGRGRVGSLAYKKYRARIGSGRGISGSGPKNGHVSNSGTSSSQYVGVNGKFAMTSICIITKSSDELSQRLG